MYCKQNVAGEMREEVMRDEREREREEEVMRDDRDERDERDDRDDRDDRDEREEREEREEEVTREEDTEASRGVTTIIIGLVIYHLHIFFT